MVVSTSRAEENISKQSNNNFSRSGGTERSGRDVTWRERPDTKEPQSQWFLMSSTAVNVSYEYTYFWQLFLKNQG